MAGKFPPPYATPGTLDNADVVCVQQLTGNAFGHDYRYYVATMKDGAEWRLRSVTSILGVLNKEALIQWAVDQAMDDLRASLVPGDDGIIHVTPSGLEAILAQARMAHYRTKAEAADLGTLAHEAIEDYLRTGLEPDFTGTDPRVSNCYDLFRDWWGQAGLSVIQTELMVYHAGLGYAGQLDFLAADQDGNPVLIDWKTSKSLYSDYDLQVVAYAKALHAMGRGTVSAMRIVRIGREDAEFEVREIPRDRWKRLGALWECCIPLAEWADQAKRDYRKRQKAREREAA
jgi:hypothetical protein